MITTTKNNITILTPDEGKVLTNGDTYSDSVFLGKNDSVENWYEIDESEVPNEEESQEERIARLESELQEAKTVNKILLDGE